MSKLTNNTTDLQAILDEVSSYKEIIETQDDLIAQISTVLESKSVPSLPVLSNPATADNIDSGFEAINGLGAVITGTSEKKDIVAGSFTPTNWNANQTIPALIGKDNFIITNDPTSTTAPSSANDVNACICVGGKMKTFVISKHSPATNGTYDKSTGAIYTGIDNYSFRSSVAYYYIGW